MHRFGEMPFVRIVIPFCAGILIYALFSFHFPLVVLFILIASYVLLQVFLKRKTELLFRFQLLLGSLLITILCVSGNQLAFFHDDLHDKYHYLNQKYFDYARVKLCEPLIEKENSYKALCDIENVIVGDSSHAACGNVILYFSSEDSAPSLRYGDVLLVKNNFREVAEPKNPDEFNYKAYLATQEIYSTAYLKPGEWKQLPERHANPLFQFSFWLRDRSREAFHKYIHAEREVSVMEALVVGYRDEMSFDVQQAYASTGVIHVLAVSGLHVGILFALLDLMLRFMNKRKQTRNIKSIFIVAVIWLFAMVSGLSGSVIRAAVMFTFLTIGKNSKRYTNTFNILAASALVILLWNPMFIMDVGFQLSYAAIIGIGILFPYMNYWVKRETKVGDFIWRTTAMSLSAQIGTLPLTIFYFHQFPIFFLLANLIIIPLSSVILIGGIALAVFQWIHPLAAFIGLLLERLEWLMNEIIVQLSRFDFALIKLGTVEWWQAMLLASFIISIGCFFIYREVKPYLFAGLLSLLLLIVSSGLFSVRHQLQKQITVYSIHNKSGIEFRNGRSAAFFTEPNTTFSAWNEKYFQKHRLMNGIRRTDMFSFNDSTIRKEILLNHSLLHEGNYFQLDNYRTCIINHALSENAPSHTLKVDAVIISGNPFLKLKNLLQWYNTPIVVFDATNSPKSVHFWKMQAASLNVKTYDVNTDGGWVVNF
ncbi:MAG TPA: ComEC/Rec2 family competence protein [Chitinophagales bacterium]|nr:ComEC/Rec2 family competence protein [Chitinophagales bacterium]